ASRRPGGPLASRSRRRSSRRTSSRRMRPSGSGERPSSGTGTSPRTRSRARRRSSSGGSPPAKRSRSRSARPGRGPSSCSTRAVTRRSCSRRRGRTPSSAKTVGGSSTASIPAARPSTPGIRDSRPQSGRSTSSPGPSRRSNPPSVSGTSRSMSRAVETSAVVAALLVLTTAARADDGGWPSFAQTLGTQLRALEARFDEGAGGLPPWLGRFRISGNGDFAYLNGDRHSPAPGGRFLVDNSRLFLDSELVDGLRLREWPLASDASFFVEWDAARDGEVLNTVGSFYLRLDHVLGLDPLNVKIGRVLIPFGEEYPRFSEQRPENPLISFSAAAPYGWDNGILFFGSSPWRSLQYVAGVMVGDTGFHVNTSRETQLDAKLAWQPVGWAHLSVSGLWTGKLGTHDEGGEAALEFGEREIGPLGSETDVTRFE